MRQAPHRSVQLFIDGYWSSPAGAETLNVHNPATEAVVAQVAVANEQDVTRALEASAVGFANWRNTSAGHRQEILRRAADILQDRAELVASLITEEEGKPLFESRAEAARCVEIFRWYADEARRAYGRVVPSRAPGLSQTVLYEPIGPVAAFSPWNFPASQAAKKLAAALAAGCSIILKGPEEAPSGCVELVRALADAGIMPGAVALLFGRPAMIAEQLIRSEVTRKVSFTGSVPVGKQLAMLAAAYMKPCTMELGGHAPVIVCEDADIESLAVELAALKFRNAGQVCVAPSRFFIHREIYDRFIASFIKAASSLTPANGSHEGTRLGPLANQRRLRAMMDFVDDALKRGARLECGGSRIGDRGFFFAPTVLTNVPDDARLMREEIFGPVVPVTSFSSLDEAIDRSNSTGYALAGYAFTAQASRAEKIIARLECGVVSVNFLAGSAAEMPLGGRKESGYGSEGGPEGLQAYLVSKSVSYRPV